jgi:hypothetical protein
MAEGERLLRLQTKNKCKPGAGKNLGGAVTEASVGMN